MSGERGVEFATLLGGALVWAPEAKATPSGSPGIARAALSLCNDKAESTAVGVYTVPHYTSATYGRAFGPLMLPDVLLFCRGLDAALSRQAEGHRLVLTTPHGDPEYRANAAVLLGAYLVVGHEWTLRQVEAALAREASARFTCAWSTEPAEQGVLTVGDCWEGMAMAKALSFLTAEMVKDDVEMKAACASYTHQSHRYDCSWIVPGRLMVGADPVTVICDPNPVTCNSLLPDGDSTALPGEEAEGGAAFPSEGAEDGSNLRRESVGSVDTVCRDFSGYVPMASSHSPGSFEDLDYVSFLRASGVGLVLRANFHNENGMPKPSYSDRALEPYGIRHANVRVVDREGGLPKKKDFAKALEVARDFWDQDPSGAVFVHCKGGFGRSVILACCLAIERFDVSGRAMLGWARIARPGAFTSPKQEMFIAGLKGREDVRTAAGLRADCAELTTKAAPSCTSCVVQ